MRAAAAATVGVLAALGPLSGVASAMQRVARTNTPNGAGVQTRVPESASSPVYVPMSWEVPGLQFPRIPDSAVPAMSQDDNALRFDLGNELGSFLPAPKGGTPFLGAGQPIFGLAAPPVLPTRDLRPLGSGDRGDTFLGTRPTVQQDTVIPHLDDTFDKGRSSFAFLGGVPDVPDTPARGSNQFPLPAMVLADKNPGVPDNILTTPSTPTPGLPTPPRTEQTTPTTPTAPTVPQPVTGTTLAPTPTTATTTTLPPVTTTTPAPTTTTQAPTTLPAAVTTTTAAPTTTTQAPTTTTTVATPVPTTPTPAPPISTTFVIGNTKDELNTCFANGRGAPATNACERIFDVANVRPGNPMPLNLTLWNVSPDSNTAAIDVRAFADGACVDGVDGHGNVGTGKLCEGLRLKVERYTDVGRTELMSCLYGCAGSTSLRDFSNDHGTNTTGVTIAGDVAVGGRVFLKLTVTLPDTGSTGSGAGKDNKYIGRTASLNLAWQFTSA